MEKIWKWSLFFKFEIREFIAVQLIKKKRWVHYSKSVQEFKLNSIFKDHQKYKILKNKVTILQ